MIACWYTRKKVCGEIHSIFRVTSMPIRICKYSKYQAMVLMRLAGEYNIEWIQPGLEVIKLEFILRLKIKRNDWLLKDTCIKSLYRLIAILQIDYIFLFHYSNMGLNISVHDC